MHLMYFTEQPMSAYDSQVGLDFGSTALMFSNKNFDPVEGSRLYNEYLEQYIYAEEMGVDGIMLNEHHNAPFCMQAKTNVFASILAAVTKRVKIVILGNPLPLAENPVRHLAQQLRACHSLGCHKSGELSRLKTADAKGLRGFPPERSRFHLPAMNYPARSRQYSGQEKNCQGLGL